MTKVLLDTDIGTDVDDAVALAYLLAQPQCELLGITTVTGEAEKRAALASVLCRAVGRDIPIYPGAEVPLEGEQRQPLAQQAPVLERWPHQSEFPRGQAVDFLRRTIRAHPGEVVLLGIGPYTNLGLLLAADPEIAGLLKALVLMGGVFDPASPEFVRQEWNVCGDLAASERVYAARPPLHRSVGLDVTQQVLLNAADVRARFTAPLLQPVLDMAEIWFEGFYPSITFHDPLTAATVFDDSVCTFAAGTITLDRTEQPGRTRFQPSGTGSPHQVASGVKVEQYFAHFFGVF